MAGKITAVNHPGFVVTDLTAAVRFFVEVLGFAEANRAGVLRDDATDRMTRLFGVHPRAIGRYEFLRIGDGLVELLAWTAPDQNPALPTNADLGGRHLALSVTDIDDLLPRLAAQPGVTVRERNDLGFYYIATPFGLEIQLVPTS